MPLPEGYLPRRGDVLVLHGTVVYDGDEIDEGKVFVRLPGDYDDRRIPLDTVIALYARKWNAGDRAMYRGNPGDVVAIADDCGVAGAVCWFRSDLGRYDTVGPNDLVDQPIVVEPPPAPAPGVTILNPESLSRKGRPT